MSGIKVTSRAARSLLEKVDGWPEVPMLRFQFNWKHQQSVVVEGERVDWAGGRITVVDAHGQARAVFDEGELSSWWRVGEPAQ
jgi:hypothetical protein